jgi:hypothetical protein
MVQDRVADGKRIAQLLASELTGLETGPLRAVAVADADDDAMPADGGAFAYRITAGGEEIATVTLYPEYAELTFAVEPAAVDAFDPAGDPPAVAVTSGVAVKDAVDLIRETVARPDAGNGTRPGRPS